MRYRLIYKTIDNDKLFYHVKDFDILKESLIRFIDEKTGETVVLPLVSTEIKVLKE